MNYIWKIMISVEQKSNKMRKIKMTDTEFEAMKSLLINQKVDWDTLFRFLAKKIFR